MQRLTNYQQFIDFVNELGFLPISGLARGLPSLDNFLPDDVWHTGDPDTDPWQWKDRASQDKQLAYGCILNGYKGFVASRLYAAFYTACHPPLSMPVRWAEGLVDRTTWQLWNLFEKHGALATFEIHRLLASGSPGTGKVDTCLKGLQAAYYITGAGNARKVSNAGQEYGWPAIRYQRVQDWAPEAWLAEAGGMGTRESWELILEAGQELSAAAGMQVEREALARALGRK